MQTNFAPDRLDTDRLIREANDILRTCVHCGFCTATCPTYVLLGDELDSPRGRIYLLKDMLENDRPASPTVVKHIDRCLSCLSCITTCPSGVDYMHLVDQGRGHIERTYRRPLVDRTVRRLLASLIPNTGRFRWAMLAGWLASPLAPLVPGRLGAMARMAGKRPALRSTIDRPRVFPARGEPRLRVALMRNCVQPALDPEIDAATVRLLTRHGCEVVIAEGQGCCGGAVQHLGQTDAAKAYARANVRAWTAAGVDRIVINVSGCGTTVKDYGHMLADEPDIAADAAAISAKAVDVTEVLAELDLRETAAPPDLVRELVVAYHSACSLQHGQQIKTLPKELLEAAGYHVVTPVDPHLCCGSAGTYAITQPDLSRQLRTRKAETLARLEPDVIVAGNVGCLNHLSAETETPLVHTVQLLDWATGGPKPPELSR
ncbi:glycolate oxidase subunit GlcF [Roseospira marina]|uniref:Glycolate oxidase iron-sulfur subunit n=1 Tax=Roseospira marina TaxID=140057 RepID=A0A5M6I9J4_9PROT|nr:glycolate oxidase subunit GlcF [Roseospira marina]KAA5604954.1 glycolate oxidase subunit GlcF [Roseospira marina]MBB4315048.1 glycolate oxidase iron-sulfur subunit [Roseospira marina]MBB5088048.1 glycolate oxidase iron-sulfur subunit [Roseospira marina]